MIYVGNDAERPNFDFGCSAAKHPLYRDTIVNLNLGEATLDFRRYHCAVPGVPAIPVPAMNK
jgi:hypothetical protein